MSPPGIEAMPAHEIAFSAYSLEIRTIKVAIGHGEVKRAAEVGESAYDTTTLCESGFGDRPPHSASSYF
jgi:hypothetical protein